MRGPELPFKPLAGAVPFPGGWLAAYGRLQGVNLAPQPCMRFETFEELVDYKPSFQVITLYTPIGLPKRWTDGGRKCEREARKLLGFPRAAAIMSAPSRRALKAKTYESARKMNKRMNPVVWSRMPQIREVAAEMQPYWQRTIYEVHPELCFINLNREKKLKYARGHPKGLEERLRLLDGRLPGIRRVFMAERIPRATLGHVLDAYAALWTARRVVARAAIRMPEEPDWDDEGLRMEFWR